MLGPVSSLYKVGAGEREQHQGHNSHLHLKLTKFGNIVPSSLLSEPLGCESNAERVEGAHGWCLSTVCMRRASTQIQLCEADIDFLTSA